MQGALGINIDRRDGEEAEWTKGDVKLQHRPTDGLSDTHGALVLESPSELGKIMSHSALIDHWVQATRKGHDLGIRGQSLGPGQLKAICQQHPSSWGNKSSD